jgi:hypothetical protein
LGRALTLTAAVLALAGGARAQSESDQELRERVDAIAEQVNSLAASSMEATGLGARVGGYAEMHYNAPQDGTTILDFHRFVLLISKPITDWIFFNSEVELEHALVVGGEESGEVELEQAYLQFQVAPWIGIRAGIILIPVGLINPVHEPPTFYGVERPDFHRYIIPTTWFDGGAGVVGQAGNVAFEAYAMSPLDASGFRGSDGIRAGRQKGFESETESLALTGMARYRAAGFALGASFWRGNSNSTAVRQCARTPDSNPEGEDDGCDNTDPVDIDSVLVTLAALDFELQQGIFALRAEYATGTIENSDKLNALFGRNVSSAFNGYYVEPSARVWQQGDHSIGVFVRYEDLNPQAEVETGSVNDSLNFTKTLVGANYWPHPDVAVKVDVERKEPKDGEESQGYNLGIGWVF